MDNIFTHDSIFTDKLLDVAMHSEKFPSPSLSSLEFIKNFARNYRVCKDVEGRAGELQLN